MKVRTFTVLAAVVQLLMISNLVYSAEPITGVVTNLYGEPLAGVTVWLRSQATETDETGTFSLSSRELEDGPSEIMVYAAGRLIHRAPILVGEQYYLELAANDDGNLLPNPGFELGFSERGYPIGWRGSHNLPFGKEFQLVEEPTRSGRKALKITYPDEHTGGIHVRTDEILSPLPVRPGEVYQATAYAYNDQGNRIVMMLAYLDEENREIPGASRTVASTSNTWAKLTVTSQPAPANAKQIRLMFWQTTDTKGSLTYIDDVHLRKVGPAADDASVAISRRGEGTVTAKVSIDEIKRVPPQIKPGEHPRLYVTRSEIEAVQQLSRQNPGLRAVINDIINVPANRVVWEYEDKEIVFPPKPPNDLGEATRRSADPVHQKFARDASTAALGFAFTGNRTMGETAKRILLTYADQYMSFSHRALREGRLTSETREEALWLIEMAWAYDLLLDSDLLIEPEKAKIEAMLREAARIINDHRLARQDINWQAGHNSALMAVGVVLEDKTLIESVLVGPKSFTDLIAQSVRDDGMTVSQSVSHHKFAIERWLLVAEAAYRIGYDIYSYTFDGKTLKDMIDLPFTYVFSHGEHPLTGHARYGTRLQFDWTIAAAYERYGDAKYLWLWHKDGFKSLLGQSESRRTLIYLPSLLQVPSDMVAEHNISFGTLGKEGRNIAGSSLLNDSGFAILRGTTDDGTLLEAIMLFKPHGTVNGHQGSDNLTIMLSGRTSVWIPGTGSPGYAYDRPEQRGWYEQTVARSGVVVDGTPQYPLSQEDTRYAVDRERSSAGRLLNFVALPTASYTSAATETVYDGVSMRRTLLLSAPYMIDRYQVRSDRTHTYDWVVHVKGVEGDISVRQTARPGPLGDKFGYQYMNQVRSGASDGTWVGTWTKPDEKMQLIMLGGEDTEIFRAVAIGESVNVPQPLVMARRRTDQTEFIALYELYRESPTVTEMSEVETDDFVGVFIKRADGQQDRWVWLVDDTNVGGHLVELAPGARFAGSEVFWRRLTSDGWSALLIKGTVLEIDEVKIHSDAEADIAVELSGVELITVSQSSEAAVNLSIALPDNSGGQYGLYRLGASPAGDGHVVAERLPGLTQQVSEANLTLSWYAEPYEVYVLTTREPSADWLERFAVKVQI